MVRERALDQFKYIRTCVLARQLCFLIRSQRASLEPEDVQRCCGFVAKLCEDADCKEASNLCNQAANIVTSSEATYLSTCEESCKKCGQSRRPEAGKAEYIA